MEEFPKVEFKNIPKEFETCFEDGFKIEDDEEPITCILKQHGNLTLPTGRLIASDSTLLEFQIPFEEKFPAGSFPC